MNTTQTLDGNEMLTHFVTDAEASTAGSSQQEAVTRNIAQMVSGIGQHHTNDVDSDNPTKQLTPYGFVTWSEIVTMAKNPPKVDKSQGRWFIPSTFASRTFKEQEAHGEYWVLCFDFDENTEFSLEDIAALFDKVIDQDIELLAYHSRSATPEKLKCRVLIPLAVGLSYGDYKAVLTLLNNALDGLGLKPDRALERAAQLVYLPNKGEHYDYACYGNSDLFFNPPSTMARELDDYFKAEAAKIEAARIEREARKEQARIKRDSIIFGQYSHPIDAFNAAFTVDEILINSGYDFDGKHSYRHPNSESGSFSASVENGRVYSLSPNDPLYTADTSNGAHDAFSVFCTLSHRGDQKVAIIDAGDNWLTINGEPWNKVAQREFMLTKEYSNALSMPLLDKISQAHGVTQGKQSEPFSLAQFSLNGTSKQMREKMLADTFILDRLAILGQITLFSAPPNAGKTLLTLWLLRQAIETGDIVASDVFYINADDNHRGLVEKLSIAEGLGFHTLAPSHNKFDPNKFLDYVKKMVADNNARGKVIILDTVKKFLDVMDKKKSSDGGTVLREFVSHGGSVIMLGHVNKHLGGDGKHIIGGTSDLRDDADCAYILTPTKHAATGETTVLFENTKSRGDVAETASYCYTRANGQGYDGLLATVRLATDEETSYARKATAMETLLQKNHELINAILDAMKGGLSLKTEIIKDAAERACASRKAIARVLVQHTGDNYIGGHRWSLTIGESNSHIYRPHSLLTPKEETIRKLYAEASNGGQND
jgi:hypothetical protein